QGVTTGNNINSSFIYEGYIYDEISLNKNLTFAPGIRYSNIEYKRKNFITERDDAMKVDAFVYSAGVIYKIKEHSRIYATVSKGFQPPSLNAALAPGTIDAGVDLLPETSLSYEAG